MLEICEKCGKKFVGLDPKYCPMCGGKPQQKTLCSNRDKLK